MRMDGRVAHLRGRFPQQTLSPAPQVKTWVCVEVVLVVVSDGAHERIVSRNLLFN
jgi:hypothetical protein